MLRWAVFSAALVRALGEQERSLQTLPERNRDELWTSGTVKNFYQTCAFQAYYAARWTVGVRQAAGEWSGAQKDSSVPHYDSVNGFDLRPYGIQVMGAESPFSFRNGSLPAVCAVANPSSAIATWVQLGASVNASAVDGCSPMSNKQLDRGSCGCWACVSPGTGMYSSPLVDAGTGLPADRVRLVNTAFFGRYALLNLGMGSDTSAKTVYTQMLNSITTSLTPAPLPATAASASSLAMYGMLLRKDASAGPEWVHCAPGLRWYSHAVGGSDGLRTFFCANPNASTTYAAQPRYAKLQSALVRTGNGGTGSSLITTKSITGAIENVVLWWAVTTLCTRCSAGNWPSQQCTFTTDTVCSACSCALDEHTTTKCDGVSPFTGCTRCFQTAFKGDSFGNQWATDAYTILGEIGRPENTIQCLPGTYNSVTNDTAAMITCMPDGWEYTGQPCKQCDPPAEPFAVNPFPAVGTASYQWTCAPGFSATSPVVQRTCPVANNLAGTAWQGAPIRCECRGIGDSHSCTSSNAGEGWVNGYVADGSNNNWLTLQYNTLSGVVWPTVATDAEARLTVLGAVRFIFELKTPSGDTLKYAFKQVTDTDAAAAAERSGQLTFTNDDQYFSMDNLRAGRPYFRAVATLRFRRGDDSGSVKTITPRDEESTLEYWYGAESAIRDKMPGASGYFAVVENTQSFLVRARMQLATDPGMGLLQAHVERELARGVREEQNGLTAYFTKRALVSVQFEWLTRKCEAGYYQIGDVCLQCPANSYSTRRFRVQQLRADNSSLLPLNGTAASGAICTNCACSSCQTCGPDTAACRAFGRSCSIGGRCMLAGTTNPNSQCSWCDPDVSGSAYTNIPAGRACDDGNACTFFDACDGAGGCRGQADTCLRDVVQPSRNCEVCGKDKCELRPGFSGCIVRDANGTKACGCSIAGTCVAHGTVNPNNACQLCDVTLDAAAWSASEPKPCDDGNLCTFGDMCFAGECSGIPITCGGEGPCVESSVCDGTDKCQITYYNNSHICQAGVDECQPPSFCSGNSTSCPTPARFVPVIQPGSIVASVPSDDSDSFFWPSGLAALSAASSGPLATTLPLGYPSTSFLYLAASNWTTPCGGMRIRMGAFLDDTGVKFCSEENVLNTAEGGLGFSGWATHPATFDPLQSAPPPAAVPVGRAFRLSPGDVLTVMLQGTTTMQNTASTGVYATMCTSVVVASAAPAAGWVRNVDLAKAVDDGSNAATVHTTQLGVTWTGFVDSVSSATWNGLLRYELAVGRSAGAADVVPWRWVGSASSAVTDLYRDVLPEHVPLYVSIRAYNRAGWSTVSTASAVVIDSSGPSFAADGYVVHGLTQGPDGRPIEQLALNSADVAAGARLTVQWGGFVENDGFSAIDHYEVAWGFRPGGTQIAEFSVVPGGADANAVSFMYSQWVPGTRYVATVRAVSTSGAYSDVSTQGLYYDETPPAAAVFLPTAYGYAPCAPLRLSYAYDEKKSRIASATVWVGSTLGGDDLMPRTVYRGSDVGSGITLPLLPGTTDGTTMYVSALLTNIAGLETATPAVTRVVYDCSAPQFVGSPVDTAPVSPAGAAVSFHTGPSLHARWTPCADPLSAIRWYEVQLWCSPSVAASSLVSGPSDADFLFGAATGMSAEGGPQLLLDWLNIGVAVSVNFTAVIPPEFATTTLQLMDGMTYYTAVRCTNDAGLTATGISVGVVVDRSAPVATLAVDPALLLNVDGSQFLFNAATIAGSVSFRDAQSGITSARIALGTSPGAVDGVVTWQQLAANATSFAFTGLQLQQAQGYVVTVETTNRAGLVTRVSSPRMVVDVTPPTRSATAAVLDGLTADVDFVASMSTYTASWRGLCSDAETGISGYDFCAGSSAGQCDLQPMMRLPPTVTNASVQLLPGTAGSSTYCAPDYSRMLVEDHPAPSHVRALHADVDAATRVSLSADGSGGVFETLMEAANEHDTREREPLWEITTHPDGSKVAVPKAAARGRSLQGGGSRQLGTVNYGPDWLIQSNDYTDNACAYGWYMEDGNFWFPVSWETVLHCIGDKLSLRDNSGFLYSGSYNELSFWGIETTVTLDGRIYTPLAPKLYYADAGWGDAGCKRGGYGWATFTVQCDAAAVKMVKYNHRLQCTGDLYGSFGFAKLCSQDNSWRVSPAAPTGPAWLRAYANSCFAGRVIDNEGGATTWRICFFGWITSFSSNAPSTSVDEGMFDKLITTASDGTDNNLRLVYDGMRRCGNWGMAKQYVDIVCARDGVERIISAYKDPVVGTCKQYFVITLRGACGNSTELGKLPSPAPTPSPTARSERFSPAPSVAASPSPSPSFQPTIPPRTREAPFYGPAVLQPLLGTCITGSRAATGLNMSTIALATSATVTVCPFRNVSIQQFRGAPATLIGWWDSWTTVKLRGAVSYDRWTFRGGNCAASPGRQYNVTVVPRCGATVGAAVLSAVETSPCNMAITVMLPQMCALSVCDSQYIGRVFGQVQCYNRAGMALVGGPVVSNGVSVDPFPPAVGIISYGAGAWKDGQLQGATFGPTARPFYFSSLPLSVAFDGFTTTIVPLNALRVRLGTRPGAADLGDIETRSTSASFSSFTPIDGASYFASVTANTTAGVGVSAGADVPAIFDGSPPAFDAVGLIWDIAQTNVSGIPTNFTTWWPARSRLGVCFLNVTEPHSPVTVAAAIIGTATGTVETSQIASVTAEWRSAVINGTRLPVGPQFREVGPFPFPTTLCVEFAGFDLPPARQITASFRLISASGMVSNRRAVNFTVDESPPVRFNVYGGLVNTSAVSMSAGNDNSLGVNTAPGNLTYYFELSNDTETGISEYWVAVGSAVTSPDLFVPDVMPWQRAFTAASAQAASVLAAGADGVRRRVVPAWLTITLPHGTRAQIAVAAVNGVGFTALSRGAIPFSAGAAVSLSWRVWFRDTTPPLFEMSLWPYSAPVLVGGLNAPEPEGFLDTSGLRFAWPSVSNQTNFTLRWAPVRDRESSVTSVRIRVLGTDPSLNIITLLNWMSVGVTAQALNFSLAPSTRRRYGTDWCAVPNPGFCFQEQVSALAYPSGVRAADWAACCDLCQAQPDCIAYDFRTDFTGTTPNCFPKRHYKGVTANANCVAGYAAFAQPVHTVELEATNEMGLNMTYSDTTFTVDDIAPTPPTTVVVMDPGACNLVRVVNLTEMRSVSAVSWTPSATTGAGQVCLIFTPAQDANTGVLGYSFSIGSFPNGTDLLPLQRATSAMMQQLRGVASNTSALTVQQMRVLTPAFQASTNSRIYVTIVAWDAAGNAARTWAQPMLLVNPATVTAGFSVWASADRQTVRTITVPAANTKRFNMSWTGPSGDEAMSVWSDTSAIPKGPVATGLRRFEVALSSRPDEMGVFSSPGWVPVGYNQSIMLDGLGNSTSRKYAVQPFDLYRRGVSEAQPFTVGAYGWAFSAAPYSTREANVSASTAIACVDRCAASTTCVAWSYFFQMPTTSLNCVLYSAASQVIPQAGVVSGSVGYDLKPLYTQVSPADASSITLHGHRASIADTGDLASRDPAYPNGVRAATVAACAASCNRSPTCFHWEFMLELPGTGANCFPFIRVPRSGTVVSADYVFGSIADIGWSGTLLRGYDVTSATRSPTWPNGVTSTAGAETECAAVCFADPSCFYWVYGFDMTKFMCYPLSRINGFVAVSNRISGTILRWQHLSNAYAPTLASVRPACDGGTGVTVTGVDVAELPGFVDTFTGQTGVPVDTLSRTALTGATASTCCAMCASAIGCVAGRLVNGNCNLFSYVPRLNGRTAAAANTTVIFPRAQSITPVYGLVSAVSNAGVRTTVSSVALSIVPGNTIIVGAPTTRGMVTSAGVTLNCSWSGFTDTMYGSNLVTSVNVLATDTSGARFLMDSAWQTVGGTRASFSVKLSSDRLTKAFVTNMSCAVQACNPAGYCRWSASDDAFAADFAPVNTGTVAMLAVTRSDTMISSVPTPNTTAAMAAANIKLANVTTGAWAHIGWLGFSCGLRGSLVSFTVCVADYSGGCNLGSRTTDSNTTNRTSLQFVSQPASGVPIYATVIATCSNLLTGVKSSAAVMNDLTPPEPPTVVVAAAAANVNASALAALGGSLTALNLVRTPSSSVFCSWDAGSDVESQSFGLTYRVSLASFRSAAAAQAGPIVTNRTSLEVNAATRSNTAYAMLAEGNVYCVVSAVNALGLVGNVAISEPIVADWSPPAALASAAVFDGPAFFTDVAVSLEPPSQLSLTWAGLYDSSSGIARYEACITKNPNATIATAKCDAANWQVTDSTSKHTMREVALYSGNRYYTCVRAWDAAGYVSTPICSNGVVVDSIAPAVSATVLADVELEALQQASSFATTGSPWAHLYAPMTDAALLEQVTKITPAVINMTAVLRTMGLVAGNLSSSTQRYTELKRIVSAVGPMGVRPRLTAGVPYLTGATLNNNTSCRVSSRASEVVVFSSGTTTINSAAGTPPSTTVRVNGAAVRVSVACIAGMEYATAVDACVPCAEGYFKSESGPGVCQQCPLGTRTYATTAAALITDVSQQTRRGNTPDGPVTCGCWDVNQQFVNASIGCVCKPGYVQTAAGAAWTPLARYSPGANGSATIPVLCEPVADGRDTRAYKAVPGNSRTLVQRCPEGLFADFYGTTCICPLYGQIFDRSVGQCLCGPNTFLSNVTTAPGEAAVEGLGQTMMTCFPCPAGTAKVGYGNSRSQCLKCPWGMEARADGQAGCVPDANLIIGPATLMPDGTSAACPPGYGVTARCDANNTMGTPLIITSASDPSLVATTVCLAWQNRWFKNKPPRPAVPIINGLSLVQGAEFALVDTKAAKMSKGVRIPYINMAAERASVPNMDKIFRVMVGFGTCTIVDEACFVQCYPCAAGAFQPNYLPLAGTKAAVAAYTGTSTPTGGPGQCTMCPSLLQGSYFVSTERTLFLNWAGAFSDGNGTGIDHYDYALGSVPGGSQVVPFTATRDTNVTVDRVAVVTGTPVYATVVAVDAAGNRGILTDSRPVLIDDTSPLPGIVLDADLDAVLGNLTASQYLAAAGVGPAAASASSLVQLQDVAFSSAGADPDAANAALQAAQYAAALMSQLNDANTSQASSLRSALTQVTLPTPTNRSSASLSPVSWRADPTFINLYGFPDSDFQVSTTTFALSWEPFLDTGSGIAAVAYCLGTAPYSCNVRGWTRVPNPKLSVESVNVTGILLPAGKMVYACVMAVNGVGLVSLSVSNGVVADDRAPTAGIVYDVGSYFTTPLVRTTTAAVPAPMAQDIDCDIAGAGIGAAWEGFASDVGITSYEWAVGTRAGATDVLNFTSVKLSGYVYNSTLKVPVGRTAYVSVRATAANGRSIIATSDGVRMLDADVDTSESAAAALDSSFRCVTPRGDGSVLTAALAANATASVLSDSMIIGLPS